MKQQLNTVPKSCLNTKYVLFSQGQLNSFIWLIDRYNHVIKFNWEI